MLKEDEVRLQHMQDAAQKAVGFVKMHSRKDLDSDEQLSFALVRLLEIVGEAANSISLQTRQQYTQISWMEIIGMRNRLIHGYFDVDLDIVWQTIMEDLPLLIQQLDGILSKKS